MMTVISNKRTQHKLCASAALVLALVVTTSCGSGDASGQQESTQIRVGAPGPVAALWPVFVARSEGFFERAGVQVSVTYAGGGQGVQQVIGGDLEVFLTHPDQPIAAIERGGDLTGISGGINSTFSLLGRPGIEDVEALRNGPVGVANVSGADSAMIRSILANSGLDEDDYNVTQTGSGPNKLSAMSTGAVNAVTLTQPQDLQYLTQTDGAEKLADSSDLGALQTIAVFAHSGWAEDNTEGLVTFLRAQLQAREWLAQPENREKAVSVLADATEISKEIATAVYDQYAEQGLFETAIDIDMTGVDQWLTLAEEAGLGNYGPADKYFDTSYLEQAKQGSN